jgi:hypothetical protein
MAKYLILLLVCIGLAVVDAQSCSAAEYSNCVKAHYDCPMDTQEQTCQCYITYYACLAPVGCLTKSNTDYERQTCINKFCDKETVCEPDLSQNGNTLPASPMQAPTTTPRASNAQSVGMGSVLAASLVSTIMLLL